MKGFSCEALIIAGAYLFDQSPTVGGGLIGMGALLSSIRYGIALGRGKIKDDLLSNINYMFDQVTSTTVSKPDVEKFCDKDKETIH